MEDQLKTIHPDFNKRDVLRKDQRKYRRLVVRWERQSLVFDGFLALGMIHLWITKIILVG